MKKNLQKGIAQLVILGVMGLLAIVLPVVTKLVQDNQENRSQAATALACNKTSVGNKKCNTNGTISTCKFVYRNEDSGYDVYDYTSPSSCTYGCTQVSSILAQCKTAPVVKTCSSYTVGNWGSCNTTTWKKTRSVVGVPTGCTGGVAKPSTETLCCNSTNCSKCNGSASACSEAGCQAESGGICVAKPSCSAQGGACITGVNNCTIVEGGKIISGTDCSGSTPVCCKVGVLKTAECNTFGNLAVGVTKVFAGDDLCVDGLYIDKSLNETYQDKFTWQCGGSGYITKNCEVKKTPVGVKPEKFCSGTCLTVALCKSRVGTTIPLDTKTYDTWSNCDDAEVCCTGMSAGLAKCGFSGIMGINTQGVGLTLTDKGDDLCELGDDSEFKITSTGWSWKCGGGKFTSVDCSALKHTVGANCAQIRDDAFCISVAQCTGTKLGTSDCRTGETCCWGISTIINGVCGTSKLTCKTGTVDDDVVADTSSYFKWICQGVHGGKPSGTCQSSKGGDSNPTVGPNPTTGPNPTVAPEITGITLSPNPLNLLVGKSGKMGVETIPAGLNGSYNWESDDANVATVDINGLVTGQKVGEAYVIARVEGYDVEANALVIVEDPESNVCIDYDYSNWGECTNGFETRTVLGYLPEGCTGEPSKDQDNLIQSCGDPESDASVSFKIAFAGIKPGAQCIDEYLIPETKLDLDIGNIPSNKYENKIQTSFEEIDGADSKGNQIFQVTSLTLDRNKFGSSNTFNYIKVKGPWHLKRRMCQDGQNGKLAESTVCNIDLRASNTHVYDFSGYTLLAGDIFTDGVVNSLDLSYIKLRLNPGKKVQCGIEGDMNMDGVVNTFDLNLTKDTLTERDDE